MSESPAFAAKAFVVESVVCGVSAFHAVCECGWRCHKKPHDQQDVAAQCGVKHLEKEH